MAGASIEDTLALFASSLRETKEWLRPLFAQHRSAVNAGLFLDGLLGDERRKTGWMRAEAAGDPGPWRQQGLLGRNRWSADALRDVVRGYVMEHLTDADAVLVIDETGFLKQGKSSCGVSRQYTGSAGKVTNCQIGVFAAYVSRHGHAFIDRALYLPKSWTDDQARLKATYAPNDTGFATKPRLAGRMIERAVATDVPFRWVAADRSMVWARSSMCCAVPARAMCWASPRRRPFIPGASRARPAVPPRRSREHVSLQTGTAYRLGQEPRALDGMTGVIWSWRTSTRRNSTPMPQAHGRGPLIRRRIDDGELAFFATWCPVGTSITDLGAG